MNESISQQAYVAFRLGEEFFALPVGQVREILELETITSVPESPAFMRGILNLRGNVLSVIDTRRKFNLPTVEDTSRTRIIVLDNLVNHTNESQKIVGILVDVVTDVLEISSELIVPPSEMSEMNQSEYVQGIAKVDEHFILLLDAQKIVGDSWQASSMSTTSITN